MDILFSKKLLGKLISSASMGRVTNYGILWLDSSGMNLDSRRHEA